MLYRKLRFISEPFTFLFISLSILLPGCCAKERYVEGGITEDDKRVGGAHAPTYGNNLLDLSNRAHNTNAGFSLIVSFFV